MKKEIEAYKKGYRITENGIAIGLSENELKCTLGKDGYYYFSFRRKDSSLSKIYIHRLQAFQKYGMILFNEGIEVRHKDGISIDNQFSNILIGTHSENMMDVPEQIRMSKALHATSFVRKYNKDKVRMYHKENGSSYKKTMAHFGITSKGSLHYALNSNSLQSK